MERRTGDDSGNSEATPVDLPLRADAPAPVGQQPADSTPEGGRDPRRVMAQHGYEMGLSLRVIGSQVGVSETAIRKWAAEGGWVKGERKPLPPRIPVVDRAAVPEVVDVTPRDLPEPAAGPVPDGQEVVREVRNGSQNSRTDPTESANQIAECEPTANLGHDMPLDQMFRQRVRQLLESPSPDEAADVAARAVVEVVRGHRRGVIRAQAIVDRLMSQLEIAADCRDLLEALIDESGESGKAKAAMRRLVSLPSHAATVRDLATAMTKLVGLERQAFGLLANDDPTPPPPPEAAPQVKHDDFERIRQRVQQRLGSATS